MLVPPGVAGWLAGKVLTKSPAEGARPCPITVLSGCTGVLYREGTTIDLLRMPVVCTCTSDDGALRGSMVSDLHPPMEAAVVVTGRLDPAVLVLLLKSDVTVQECTLPRASRGDTLLELRGWTRILARRGAGWSAKRELASLGLLGGGDSRSEGWPAGETTSERAPHKLDYI